MQANLLPFLNSSNCKALFAAKTLSSKSIQKDFARFLAAYFLNLPLIYSNDAKRCLPTLFEWTQASPEDLTAKGYLSLPRDNLAAKLSPEFSPRSAILLLCKCELVLEAVLYSDYFNDFRTGLILRFYIEKTLNLNLIQNTFENLIENLFAIIENFNGAEHKLQDVTASLNAHIECIIQISVVFDITILKNVEVAIIEQVEYLFSSLETRVPDNILLPRPPVFSLPAQFSLHNNHELQVWNKIYFLIRIYVGLLQRTNRLHVILAKILEEVNNVFIHSDGGNNVTRLVHGTDNDVLEESLDNFYCLLLMVLRMFYRDNLSIARKEGWEGIEIMEETYSRLFPSLEYKTDKEMFQNFLNHSAENDFDSIFTFLHFLRENYRQNEVFLPPLSNETLHQWQSIYSSTTTLLKKDSTYESEPEWMFPEKAVLSLQDVSKVRFISSMMKTILLIDPTLIQICLRIEPENLFETNMATISQQLSILTEDVINIQPTQRSFNPPMVEKDFTSFNESVAKTSNSVLSSEESEFDLDLYENEVKQEREFIRHLHISPVYYPPISDNYRPKIAPPKPKRGVKESSLKTFANITLNDKLKQELESITTRLAKLRPAEIQPRASVSLQSSRQSSQRSQDTVMSSLESGSSSSKKLKHESKARMKRDRVKKAQETSSSVSSPKEEVQPQDTSERKRQCDYLQDMTLIPVPQLPKLEKLDLNNLSPPIQKKSERTWQQIEIYSPSLEELREASVEMSSIRNGVQVNLQPNQNYTNQEQGINIRKPQYPDWLRLIPPKDDDSGRPNTSTSRLLDIEQATKLGRKTNLSDSFKRYDSGFLDEVATSHRSARQHNTHHSISDRSPIAFACSMTQEQIENLVNMCN